MDSFELLKTLCGPDGLSGKEGAVREAALSAVSTCAPPEVTPLGSLLLPIKRIPGAKEHILLDAHIDQIGMVVTGITEEGFLRVNAVGGLDTRTLPAATLTVYGKKPLPGVICSVPPHVSSGESGFPKVEELAVDVGLSKAEAEEVISLGDYAAFDAPLARLLGKRVTGRALDNRAGAAAVLLAANALFEKELPFDLTVLLSSMEEVGLQGARTGAFSAQPTKAIVVDVSFGLTPELRPTQGGKVDGGPMLGISPILDRDLFEKLRQVAKEEAIDCQVEVMGGTTGTNADAITLTRGGVKTALVSVPLKYMHTPVEVIDLSDIEATAALIAAYLERQGR